MEILYVFVQLLEIQDHSPSVIFLRSHKDWRYMYSLFEWWAFLITPFFSSSDTSKSVACVCSVENVWLCAVFSCNGSSAKSMSTPSTIFRISSSILICFHWARQKRIWPALKSSDCFCNSSSILGTLLQKSLTSFGSAFWFLAVTELSYPSLVPRFCSPPEAAVAPLLTVLRGEGGGSVLKKGLFCLCL